MNHPQIYRLTDRPLRLLALTLALSLGGALALSADAAPPPPGMMGGPGAPMMMMGGPGHIQHMLDAVNATPDQRSQIKAIMDAAHADMKAQRDAGRTLHEQGMQLFTQPTVDARAAETLRQQMLAQQDAASKRTLQAMLDISRVLTPDQRAQLGTQMAQRKAMMERHRAEREAIDKPVAR